MPFPVFLKSSYKGGDLSTSGWGVLVEIRVSDLGSSCLAQVDISPHCGRRGLVFLGSLDINSWMTTWPPPPMFGLPDHAGHLRPWGWLVNSSFSMFSAKISCLLLPCLLTEDLGTILNLFWQLSLCFGFLLLDSWQPSLAPALIWGLNTWCWLFRFFLIFKILIYLLNNFWLYWVSVPVRGLSLVAVSESYFSLWCIGFSRQCLLLLQVTGHIAHELSLVASWEVERAREGASSRRSKSETVQHVSYKKAWLAVGQNWVQSAGGFWYLWNVYVGFMCVLITVILLQSFRVSQVLQ